MLITNKTSHNIYIDGTWLIPSGHTQMIFESPFSDLHQICSESGLIVITSTNSRRNISNKAGKIFAHEGRKKDANGLKIIYVKEKK